MSTRVVLDQGALDQLLRGESGPVANEILRHGITVERLAKELCPVGTPESTGKKGYRGGRLRASITGGAEIMKIGDELGVQVGTDVYYALYVEMGTYKMAPQPYLRPALAAAGGGGGSFAADTGAGASDGGAFSGSTGQSFA